MNSSPSGVGGAVGSGVGAADAPVDAALDGGADVGAVPPDAVAAADGVALFEPVHAAMTGARAAAPPRSAIALQQVAPADLPLRHVADERALEVDRRAVVGMLGHGMSSMGISAAGPRPSTRASAASHATATSLPTGRRIPAFGARTVRPVPPVVLS